MNTEVKRNQFVSRTTGLVIGIILIVGLMAAGAWWLLRTNYEPLLAESNPESRAETLAMLMQWQIPYKVDETTGAISVPSEQVAQIRARLSGFGLPANQVAGLEVFGQGDYGMSEFAQRINYQRGLEGELAKTIRTFEEIKSARVHLTLAKSSLFENRKESAKASVAVQLKPDRTLTQQQISGIQQLVAGAITGLNPEQVVVLDEQGKPLVTGEASDGDRWSNVRVVERDYEERARRLIASIISEANINVSVKLQFNFDRVRSVKEIVIPAQNGNGYLLKKREQTANGQSPNSDETTSVQNNATNETEYIYGKERSEIEHASGVITRVNIGVVVGKSLTQENIDAINKILRSGLGLSDDRGDSIAVVGSMVTAVSHLSDKDDEVSSQKSDTAVVASKSNTNFFTNYFWIFVVLFGAGFLVLCCFLLWPRSKLQATPRLTEREREQLLMEMRSWLAQEQNGAN